MITLIFYYSGLIARKFVHVNHFLEIVSAFAKYTALHTALPDGAKIQGKYPCLASVLKWQQDKCFFIPEHIFCLVATPEHSEI